MKNNIIRFIHRFTSPYYFYRYTQKIFPILAIACIALFFIGTYAGLIAAPADYKQGDGFRIIYIHVPAAMLSLSIYIIMAMNAAIYLIWKIKLADMLIYASAPIGASYTLLALVSGAIWGKPMWGTWWVWDARLTSELVLLFLYLGYLALYSAIPNRNQAGKVGSILLLIGVVDIPIIHFSVNWWFTLHQGASLSLFSKPTIAPAMLYPLLIMLAAFFLFYVTMLLFRVRTEILRREYKSAWVKELTL